MSDSYDIGIVGAGAHGASAAYHLSRRGISTIVFERGARVSGPTAQASGIVRSYYTNGFLAEIASQSTAVLADLGAASGFVATGGLYLHGPDELAEVRATSAGLTAAGVEHDLLDAAQLAARFPELDLGGVAIGVWEQHAGYADPPRTALELVGRAIGQGAELREHAPVREIRESGDSVLVTLADGSSYQVGRLLVAAGPWTAPLVSQLGVTLPLTVERHVVAGLRYPSGTSALPYVLIDVVGGYYSRPVGTDRTWLGPLAPADTADPDDFAAEITAAELDWLAARAGRRITATRGTEPDRSWASLYDVSPDWQPVIGQVSPHVYVDAGTSGHGFKLSPVLGDHVARLLIDDADPRLAQFSPDRFRAGSRLASGFGAARILG